MYGISGLLIYRAFPLQRHFTCCLVLIQPRKPCSDLTEKLLTGMYKRILGNNQRFQGLGPAFHAHRLGRYIHNQFPYSRHLGPAFHGPVTAGGGGGGGDSRFQGKGPAFHAPG